MTDQEQPLISHLVELRNRLLKAILLVLAIFLGLFCRTLFCKNYECLLRNEQDL